MYSFFFFLPLRGCFSHSIHTVSSGRECETFHAWFTSACFFFFAFACNNNPDELLNKNFGKCPGRLGGLAPLQNARTRADADTHVGCRVIGRDPPEATATRSSARVGRRGLRGHHSDKRESRPVPSVCSSLQRKNRIFEI